jgi:hypothetical protein
MADLIEEGATRATAFEYLEEELSKVIGILSPAIQQGLAGAIQDLQAGGGGFEAFKEGLTANLQEQMKMAVVAAAQQDFVESIITSAFDEVGSIQDLLGDYFSGELTLDEFTIQFDLAMNKIEEALSTEEFERFRGVLEALGITVDETTDKISEAQQGQIDNMKKSFEETIRTYGMSDYQKALYDIRKEFIEYKNELEEMGMLYDEQGNLTEVASLALAAYNIEMRKLHEAISQSIADAKQQIATMGMPSGQASSLALAAQYGMAPSTFSGGGGEALLQQYMGSSTAQIINMAESFGISVDDLNQDMIEIGQLLLEESQSSAQQAANNHAEAQAKRQDLIRSLDQALSSIDGMLESLRTGSLAPVQSMEGMQNRYNELVEQMRTSDDPGKYAAELQSFLPDYMKFMGAYGTNYKDVVAAVEQDLEGVRDKIKTERDLLGEIAANTSSTSGYTSSTATNTANFLNLGIPISFDTSGITGNASLFLEGLGEIISAVGWNNQITLDFITNYQNWDTISYQEFIKLVQSAASVAPDGWHTQAIIDLIMSYENWDLASLEEKMNILGFLKNQYGWTGEATIEFLVDLSEAGMSMEELSTLFPKDETIRKTILAAIATSGDFTQNELLELVNAWGTGDAQWALDILGRMETELMWPGGEIKTVIGEPVTIAKFGNVAADTWTHDIWDKLSAINAVLSDTRLHIINAVKNLRSLNQGLNFPSYASGGAHSGGFRIVGERGPELEFTGPSRIASNEESVDMIAAAVSKALSGSNTNGPIHITLNVDRRQIGKVVIDEMRHNPEFGRQMTKQLKVA